MALVVVGISQTGDVSAVRKALSAAGLPLDGLQTVEPDAAAGSGIGGRADARIITSDQGTRVPGLGSPSPFRSNENLTERVGDLEIPDSEIDNFVQAVERGRTVVGYFPKTETADAAETAFREAGLANVRRYA
ncbi:MAG: hypothetical protein GIW95_06500 [Candidatus Eremiobacteraeota bacterium]|nr:hypothetical protein [Candidatus Eremiobacteraeota bacterium]